MSDLKVKFTYAGWGEGYEHCPFVFAEFEDVAPEGVVQSLVGVFDTCAREGGLRREVRIFISGDSVPIPLKPRSFFYMLFDELPAGTDSSVQMSSLTNAIREASQTLHLDTIV